MSFDQSRPIDCGGNGSAPASAASKGVRWRRRKGISQRKREREAWLARSMFSQKSAPMSSAPG